MLLAHRSVILSAGLVSGFVFTAIDLGICTDTCLDDLDKLLLLTIQSESNAVGVSLPWEGIGERLGIGATGGAIIQHLAKMRSRRVNEGLPVPPPLRRGGGAARMPPNSNASARPHTSSQTKSSKRMPCKFGKSNKFRSPRDDEADDESDGMWDSDPDGDYGKSRSKYPRKTRRPAIKESDSSDNGQSPTKAGEKRKRGSKSGMLKNKYSPKSRGGIKAENPSDSDEDTNSASDSDQDVSRSRVVGAGSKFLALEDDYDARIVTARKTVPRRSSMVVKLPVGRRLEALADRNGSGEPSESDAPDSASASLSGSDSEDVQYPIKRERDDNTIPEHESVRAEETLECGYNRGYSGSTLREDPHPLSFAREDIGYVHDQSTPSLHNCRSGDTQMIPYINNIDSRAFGEDYPFHNLASQQSAFSHHDIPDLHQGLSSIYDVQSAPASFQINGRNDEDSHISPYSGYRSLSLIDTSGNFGGTHFDDGLSNSIDSTAMTISPEAFHKSPIGKPAIHPHASTNFSSGLSTAMHTPGAGLHEQDEMFSDAGFHNYIDDQ